MGVVYEAYDQERQELVALKTLRHVDGRRLARFKHEFRSLHDLSHHNLVSLGELFDGESELFFTMELIRGVGFLAHVRGLDEDAFRTAQAKGRGEAAPQEPTSETSPSTTGEPGDSAESDEWESTDEEIKPARPPQPRVIQPIAYDEVRLRAALRQLAVGIAALHEAGKVHRDIKPRNILVADDGRVVLLDFGLVTDKDEADQSSEHSGVVGTVAYMAPEQALSGKVTPAADWYSMGVVLFEALTGALPHTGRTSFEMILKKQQYMAAPPRQFVDTVPPDLDVLCSELLAREPADRPCAADIFDRLGIDENHGQILDGVPSLTSLSAEIPFVGRTEELGKLRAAFDGVDNAPLITLVEGVSGVGKSQLVEEFLKQLIGDEPDAVVLSGRCYEREVVSYKAFDGIADALADYLSHLPAAEVAELMPPRAALLARLFPVLKQVEAIAAARTVPDAPDPHDQRRRMFAALRTLFMRLTSRGPVVWYIDDLQWTDADSLFLLQDLIAHEQRLPVLIIATLRPVEDTSRKALLAQVAELAPTEHILLEDLTPRDARALADLLLPGQSAAALATVAADAGGHPLLLHELARHIGISSVATTSGATLDEMLTARMNRLTQDARTVLQVVAVFGGPVTQEVAALAAELSYAALGKAARVLRAAHLVRTDGVGRRDRIVTYHDRVREHIAARLDATQQQHLHERLALALEQTGAAEHDPRALVRHARAAGRKNLAATYAQTAAGYAVAALAFDQAATLFATALELGTYDEQTLRRLRIELATALVNAGRGPEAAVVFMAAAEGADPAERLDCQRQAAEQWIVTGHINNGLDTLRASLADIGEPLASTPRRALGRLLWNRLCLRLRGLGYQRRVESQVPVEVLRRLDVLRATAHGLAMVDNIRGADFNGRFLRLALRTGEPLRLVQALGTEVVFLASQGGRAARRGRRVFAKLVQLAEDSPDNAYYRAWTLLADGAASFFEGRFAPSLRALQQGETVVTDTAGTTYERNNIRVFRVHALRQLGALRQNSAVLTESVRSGQQRGDRYLETTLRILQVQTLLARDELTQAYSNLDTASWTPLGDDYHVQHWYELEARAELALYEGKAVEAVQALAPSFEGLHRSMLLRVKTVRAIALGTRARLLLAAGTLGHAPQRARVEVGRIAKRLVRERAGYATVLDLLLRAGLGCITPDQTEDETVDLLRQAVRHARDNDMALHLAAARHFLGTRLGGDEGAALCAKAASWATDEGVVEPLRMYEVVGPGCAPP